MRGLLVRWRRGDGQATVEMALVLPMLIWLLVGMVDVARIASSVLLVQHAAREGLRLGVTGASDSQIALRVLNVAPTLEPTLVTISVSPAGVRTTGSDVTVTVGYRYKVLALMGIIGTEVPLGAGLTARVE